MSPRCDKNQWKSYTHKDDAKYANISNKSIVLKMLTVRQYVVLKKSEQKVIKERSVHPTCNDDGFLIDLL